MARSNDLTAKEVQACDNGGTRAAGASHSRALPQRSRHTQSGRLTAARLGAFLAVALIAAGTVTAYAQSIPFDPESGAWFPYGSPRDYETGKRSYANDLKAAAAENPGLVLDVCRALASQPAPAAGTSPRLQSYRTMINVWCAARLTMERERSDREKAADRLAQWMDATLAATRDVPESERKSTQRALLQQIDTMEPGSARVGAVFRAIALRPQDARGAWYLLQASVELTKPGPGNEISEKDLAVFVESLYRARAQALGPDALNWEDGLPEVLLYLGKLEEAHRLQADQAAAMKDNVNDYNRMLLAVLEELSGRTDAVSAAFHDCANAQYGREVVWSVATRTARVLHAPPAPLANLLATAISWFPDNWPLRLDTLRLLSDLSPVLARRELTALYSAEDIPAGAMLDLIRLDSGISSDENDHHRVIALNDCWLRFVGWQDLPFPVDGWSRLAALPEPDPATIGVQPCFSERPASAKVIADDCITAGLYKRLLGATYGKEWRIARQTIEHLVAYVLANDLAPSVARNALVDFAVSLTDGDRRDEAVVIAKYLEGQPKSRIVTFKLSELTAKIGSTPDVVFEPWPSPTVIEPGYLPTICQDRASATH